MDLGADRRPHLGPYFPQGRVCGGATQPQSRRTLERQAILAIVVNDGALLTSLVDGQLRCTFGTLRLLHDLVAQLAITKRCTMSAEDLSHIGWIHLVAQPGCDGPRAGAGKPETLGIEFQQSWWLGWTVAKLKAQLQSG